MTAPTDLITFDLDGPIEVRDLEQRLVSGRIVPYGEQIQIRGRPESFALGSLANVTPTSVKLLRDHDRRQPLGRMVALEERADGAHAVFKVSKTTAGDEALTLAADGVLSFSPGFHPGDQTREGVHTRISALPETSLVTFAAYPGAEVLSVRTKEVPMDPVIDAPVETAPVVDLSPLETRMEDLASQLISIQSSINVPAPKGPAHGPTPLDWFAAEVDATVNGNFEKRSAFEASFAEYQTRALDDVIGTYPGASPIVDASGLVSQQYIASQLVNVLDTRRPLFSRLGSFPAPRSGYAVIPVVTQHTEVTARTVQKATTGSRPLIVQKQTFEAKWYSGAVDIAIELIRTAELSVLDLIWNDLLGQYAIVTEAAVVASIDAGGLGFTYEGATLTLTNYGTFIGDVAAQALVVRTNSGAPATKLAVTTAQWPTILGLLDGTGRRVFATRGPTNADGAATLNAESVELDGGIEVFPVPGLDAAMLFNEQSLKAADYGPERVEAMNVELMGHDLGVLGRTMFVPRIPAGVVVFGADPES